MPPKFSCQATDDALTNKLFRCEFFNVFETFFKTVFEPHRVEKNNGKSTYTSFSRQWSVTSCLRRWRRKTQFSAPLILRAQPPYDRRCLKTQIGRFHTRRFTWLVWKRTDKRHLVWIILNQRLGKDGGGGGVGGGGEATFHEIKSERCFHTL